MYFFETELGNGYKHVQLHVQGNFDDHAKEQIDHIVEVVADMLDCETQDIVVNGVKPSNSFFLVLSFKEVYTRKLSKINEQNRHRLMNLNIDYLIVDSNTIFLQSEEGKSPSGTPEKGMPNNPRCRRLQASTALCWNSTSSTQNKEGKLEIEKDNIDKIISDPNSPLEKRYLNFKKIILKKDLCNSNETKTKYFPSNFPVF